MAAAVKSNSNDLRIKANNCIMVRKRHKAMVRSKNRQAATNLHEVIQNEEPPHLLKVHFGQSGNFTSQSTKVPGWDGLLSYTYITIMYRSQWESAVGKRS